MWISVITYSADAIKGQPAKLEILRQIQYKANSMAVDPTVGGHVVPGFEPVMPTESSENQDTVVKRVWYTEEAAEKFVNYVNSIAGDVASAAIETV